MARHSPLKETQNNLVESSNSRVILLCAPAHDKLTEYTFKLFENFPVLGARTILRKIENPLTYDQLISDLSIEPDKTEVVLVFCGHGGTSSLLGPSTSDNTQNETTLLSSFYDESHIKLGPLLMLAYCCNAAAELGDSFANDSDGRTFVGFDRKIGFVLKDGDYEKWWRNILHGMASAMVNAADVHELEESIRGIYKEALSVFDLRSGQKYKYGLMMSAYLRQQVNSIKFI